MQDFTTKCCYQTFDFLNQKIMLKLFFLVIPVLSNFLDELGRNSDAVETSRYRKTAGKWNTLTLSFFFCRLKQADVTPNNFCRHSPLPTK